MRSRSLLLVVVAACGGGVARTHAVQAPSPPSPASVGGLAVPRPEGKLRLADARRYMLALINRDRASERLPPLELDEGPATIAGQRHAEDMAKHAFVGHWGTDGSVPEQRYTEAGGSDINFENAACVSDEQTRALDPNPAFDPKMLEDIEAQFFGEKPPNDGHRKNILRPGNKRVGIGIAIAQPLLPHEIMSPCVAQEFTYVCGTYGKLPAKAKVGDKVHVEGTLAEGVTFGGVGVARVDLPRAMSPRELNTRRHYPQVEPFQLYAPKGFRTAIPVDLQGSRFSIDVPLSDGGKPGLYEISVWAKIPGQKESGFVAISQRTIVAQ